MTERRASPSSDLRVDRASQDTLADRAYRSIRVAIINGRPRSGRGWSSSTPRSSMGWRRATRTRRSALVHHLGSSRARYRETILRERAPPVARGGDDGR
jgi:hypothetical protein